jgi:hypothetical protein
MFFNGMLHLFGGSYSNPQTAGLNAILDEWEKRAPNGDLRWLAYMFATVFHETARTMQPVREAFWLSEQWRKDHLKYYPYYGRGFVQLTWSENYAKAAAYVGANLVDSPDLALRLDYASAIMFVGMSEGWFRADRQGRRETLSRYFAPDVDDPVGAREIINGPEWVKVNGQTELLATVIAQYHASFLAALSAQTLTETLSAGLAHLPLRTMGIAAPRPTAPFDPVDAVEYGLLIEAVYTMNANAAGSSTPPIQSDFPPGYKLIAWVQMKDFVLSSTALKFYGVVAQSITQPHRFVLALRGTEGAVEWLDDATSVWKTPFKIPGSGSVSVGFNTIYETMVIVEAPSAALGTAAAEAVKPKSMRAEGGFSSQVAALLHKRGPTGAARAAGTAPGLTETLDVVAHSLGAALATLYVMENASTNKVPNPILYTFASPMVGDATFAAAFDKLGLTSWRIVNSSDVVPMLPSGLLGYQHIAADKTYSSSGKVQPSVACWHAMATYLSLIDPTRLPDAECRLVPAVPMTTPKALAPAAVPAPSSTSAIDCYGNVTAYLPHLKSIGVKAVGRYYSIYPAKVLSKKEAQLISEAGLAMFVVYEDGAAPGDFNSDSGTFAAQHALQLAANVGQPKGSAIYFGADFASDANQVANLIIPYFQAIQAVFADVGSPYKIGVYGDGLACERLLAANLCDFTWLSASSSYPDTAVFYRSKRWNLAQGPTASYGGLSADPDEVNGEFGAFTLVTTA